MKTKPYPWKCPRCRKQAVELANVDYATTTEHDGRAYEVTVPAMEVPQCRNCGKIAMTESANQQVSDAFRQSAGLLSPIQIKQGRQSLGYNQQEFADCLGVAGPTVCRWEMVLKFSSDFTTTLFGRSSTCRNFGIIWPGFMASDRLARLAERRKRRNTRRVEGATCGSEPNVTSWRCVQRLVLQVRYLRSDIGMRVRNWDEMGKNESARLVQSLPGSGTV